MFHVRGVFKIFLGRAPNCDILYSLSVCFFGGVSLKQIKEKTALRGPGACSPGKFLKFYMVQWPI